MSVNPTPTGQSDPSSPSSREAPAPRWWQTAVVYQVYPRSFADANGDGIGDLPGITAKLPHLRDLGVNAVWISPFYVSPMVDAGYDVADYRDIDPVFGTLADADRLIARAHELGLKVIVDVVPNHTSSAHPWFQAALAAEPGSPKRDRYLFRKGRGENHELPPNNWQSTFHGPAWTQTEGGWWYLHMFASAQPDLNWENPEVHDEFESVLRFWCDRGVDGFRIDVAHGLVKAPGLPDLADTGERDGTDRGPMWDQEGVHDIYRRWRRLLDGYNPSDDPDGDRILVAEAWVSTPERAARYVRPDEMHHAFGFAYLVTPWDASRIEAVVERSLAANTEAGAISTWVLSNHDVVRHASRLGFREMALTAGRSGIGADDPQPDAELGRARARAATTFMLALPGSAYLYQGEEFGLPEATQIPDDARQDPTWVRSGGADVGRDGCRVPIPWKADAPAYGFNDTGETWLPQPEVWADLAPDRQKGQAGSTLELYRTLIGVRREERLAEGSLTRLDVGDETVAAFASTTPTARIAFVLNTGDGEVELPAGEVLAASGPLRDGALPGNTSAWVRLAERTGTR